MDEPTNHLDLGSIEALERMLAGLPGALLLVSHDAALVRATIGICLGIRCTPSSAWDGSSWHKNSPIVLTGSMFVPCDP